MNDNEKNKPDVALGMLKRAEKDLKVAKRNYRKRDFAHSVTNMQQAVEKFGKAILLSINQCKEEDLKNEIQHKLVDFIIKIVREKLNALVGDYPDLEQNIKKAINKFQTDYKKKYNIDEDLYIEINKLKEMLKEYHTLENKIRKGTLLWLDNLPLQEVLNQWFSTSEEFLSELEHRQDMVLTDEQRINAKNASLDYVISGQFFRELQNTIYAVFLLSYTVILSVNLEKHVSSSRYDIREEKYSKKSEIVQILPLMNKTMRKMVDTCYYLIKLNPEEI